MRSSGGYKPINEEGVETTSLTGKSSNGFVWAIAALHCLASLGFGYNTAIMSPAMNPMSEYFGLTTPAALSSSNCSDSSSEATNPRAVLIQSLITSLTLVGALVGALFTGGINDAIGRHKSLLITEGIFTIGCAICAFSYWVAMLLVGRFILGLAVGAASVSVPLMVSEISPPEIRGQIGVLNQLGITFGMLLAYALGTGFSFIPPPDNWRVMFGFPIIFCLVHVVIAGIFVRAESPRWLVMRSKFADARTMLKWLRRTDNIEGEMKELQAVAGDGAQTHTMSLREQIGSLFVPFRPVCIAVGLMFLQQITGINAVMYYLTPFLRNAGMSETLADEMGIVVGVVNVLMTIISVALIDRLGRKPLLLMSFSGMTVSLALIGVFSFVTWLPKITASVTSVIFTVTFVMCFAIGLGPVPWCMVSEIFPSQISALAVSISLVTNWGTNLLVSMTFLYLMKALGVAVVFWIFSGLSVVGILFSLFVAIETKGRSVEDIVQSLSGNKEK